MPRDSRQHPSSGQHPVQLAVYDLSRGMARLLFSQFFGAGSSVDDIDCIPHTAVLVYGKEYFFGSGIQIVTDIPRFRSTMGMHPIQVLDMGFTSVDCADFEQWIHRQQQTQWSPSTYDLFHRNCNHFSETALRHGLRLHRAVFPQWILDIPRKVLSTPLGQQLQPFLQQMGSTTVVPMTASDPRSARFPSVSSSSSSASTSTAVTQNPWATTSTPASSSVDPLDVATPILDAHAQPLVSDNTQAVQHCIDKLVPRFPAVRQHYQRNDIHAMLQKVCNSVLNEPTTMLYALMLLRLMVLRQTSYEAVVEWTLRNEAALLSSDNANITAMVYCVWSNILSKWKDRTPRIECMLQYVVRHVTDGQSSKLQQAAICTLYNLVLTRSSPAYRSTDGLDDLTVTIVCTSIQALSIEDVDSTVAFRLLVIIGRLLLSSSGSDEQVKQLLSDLGLREILEQRLVRGRLKQQPEQNDGVCREVMSLLES